MNSVMLNKIKELHQLALRQHYFNDEDTWYSCPKSPDGCANEAEGIECNCGADKHNEVVNKLFEDIFKYI